LQLSPLILLEKYGSSVFRACAVETQQSISTLTTKRCDRCADWLMLLRMWLLMVRLQEFGA
jgi:hypothetical protein